MSCAIWHTYWQTCPIVAAFCSVVQNLLQLHVVVVDVFAWNNCQWWTIWSCPAKNWQPILVSDHDLGKDQTMSSDNNTSTNTGHSNIFSKRALNKQGLYAFQAASFRLTVPWKFYVDIRIWNKQHQWKKNCWQLAIFWQRWRNITYRV